MRATTLRGQILEAVERLAASASKQESYLRKINTYLLRVM